MNKATNTQIVTEYFKAFNEGDSQKMLNFLHPQVEHDINQGKTEVGLEAFKKFMQHMDQCYKEQLKDMTVFSSEGNKVSAEYDVHGEYLKTDGSLPAAKNQKYIIRAGSFFEIIDGKIKRVTTYYNLPQWIAMVSR